MQMLGKIRTQGHGCFIILPDLPSPEPPHFPGLCFKKSHGLLSRVSESNVSEQWIFQSTRLFGSREDEKIDEASCSVNCLDSVTVSEEFVADVDRFVETMDKVSNGAFLRGDSSELISEWVELDWLKAKGYYSMEAFIANKLEVNLRLAWLNCSNGKKRGVKLKEKLNAAGAAANVYWRKKGCLNWWVNLGAATRKKIWNAVLGKAAKSLTLEILRGTNSVPEDGRWLFSARGERLGLNYLESSKRTVSTFSAESSKGTVSTFSADIEFGFAIRPASLSRKLSSLTDAFNGLHVLQDIVSLIVTYQHIECDLGKVFFSSLDSVSNISDCILRKLRGFLMVISLDCIKQELEEGNSKPLPNCKPLPNKSKEKLGSSGRKKKSRSSNLKRQTPVPKLSLDGHSSNKLHKDNHSVRDYAKKVDLMESKGVPCISFGKDTCERGQGMVVGKGRTTARKSKKDKNKKNSSLKIPNEVENSEISVRPDSPSSVIFQDEKLKFECAFDNSNPYSPPNLLCGKDINARSTLDNILLRCTEGVCHTVAECKQSLGKIENQTPSSQVEALSCEVKHDANNPIFPATRLDGLLSSESMKSQTSFHANESEAKDILPHKPARAFDGRRESSLTKKQEKKSCYAASPPTSSECFSYEWPSVAPFYFPSVNSHLPAATDRLHLDVGHNWRSPVRQPFISAMGKTRNTTVEGGCNPTLSRPMPMSLDWPPMVRSSCGLAALLTCNYDSGFITRRQSSFQQNLASQSVPFSAKTTDDEHKYSRDFKDLSELPNTQDVGDECDSHWISEEEFEVHAVSGMDYNQYFGGGVMYWNPSDHLGTGFSRPPSLSSDDSSWAWHEADMNRAIDDMVAFPSSYSTTGLTSPTAASFCSPFDPLGPGHQPLGYVVSGNEVPGKVLHSSSTTNEAAADEEISGSLASLSADVEGNTGDSLSYPVLRPIIIPNISRERPRSEFKHGFDLKSPCVPPTRREQPRIKRPPSPVVLCVPRAPRPPPPSPVSDSGKKRGFPTVRSGSSSPRHWGVRGWYHDGTNLEEACLRMDGAEVVWPSWRNKSLSACQMIQPLPGALLQDRLIAMSQLARDQEHPDVAFPLQPPEVFNCSTRKASFSLMHNLLHDEIDYFCKQVAAENMARKPYINWAVKRVTRSLQVLWPRSRTNVFGSNATGLSLPSSDVDLVVCLPPVRNLEPIKEAGILEGRNGIKETCLQHAARYLANQEWVKNDSLKTVENTAIPIIMLVVEVPCYLVSTATSNVQPLKDQSTCTDVDRGNRVSSDMIEDSSSPKCSHSIYEDMIDVKSVRLDISFKSPSHTGLQTTELVKGLTEQFPAATPLALVLKQFLADRSLDQSYSGGLSSYCLVLLITRFLQHEHHLGRPINQNFGSLLMDFLYFFGNVFDPRQMRVSVQGSGIYVNRVRGYSIDPLHIDDPLFPTNNVGRNCFRIHQCIKAFSEAYSLLENELTCLPGSGDSCLRPPYKLLPKIIPSISLS